MGGEGEPGCALAHHVFLSLIEPNLAEGEAAEEEVEAGGDEAVVADLLVQAVYVLRAVPGGGESSREMSVTQSTSAHVPRATHHAKRFDFS